jgi:hypothetical protein
MSLHFAQGRLKGALGRPPIEDLFSVSFLNERHRKANRKQKRNKIKQKNCFIVSFASSTIGKPRTLYLQPVFSVHFRNPAILPT